LGSQQRVKGQKNAQLNPTSSEGVGQSRVALDNKFWR
jgi:hypothetical protein